MVQLSQPYTTTGETTAFTVDLYQQSDLFVFENTV